MAVECNQHPLPRCQSAPALAKVLQAGRTEFTRTQLAWDKPASNMFMAFEHVSREDCREPLSTYKQKAPCHHFHLRRTVLCGDM